MAILNPRRETVEISAALGEHRRPWCTTLLTLVRVYFPESDRYGFEWAETLKGTERGRREVEDAVKGAIPFDLPDTTLSWAFRAAETGETTAPSRWHDDPSQQAHKRHGAPH